MLFPKHSLFGEKIEENTSSTEVETECAKLFYVSFFLLS